MLGVCRRAGDLFGQRNILLKAKAVLTRGLAGVDNVYTQARHVLPHYTIVGLGCGKRGVIMLVTTGLGVRFDLATVFCA